MFKTQILTFLFAFLLSANFVNAQTKSEVIPVSGNCGMCKSNIEKAAKTTVGVSFADWNKETKMLTVKYDAKKADASKIQQSIANAGYDTRDIKGSDAAYEKLHNCCKYERTKTYPAITGVSNKTKGGDMACCEKKDAQCCKDKLKAKASGKAVECKKDAAAKDCCDKM